MRRLEKLCSHWMLDDMSSSDGPAWRTRLSLSALTHCFVHELLPRVINLLTETCAHRSRELFQRPCTQRSRGCQSLCEFSFHCDQERVEANTQICSLTHGMRLLPVRCFSFSLRPQPRFAKTQIHVSCWVRLGSGPIADLMALGQERLVPING